MRVILYAFCIGIVFLLSTCGTDEVADPCKGKEWKALDFKIGQPVEDSLGVTDTVLMRKIGNSTNFYSEDISFVAPQGYVSYSWKIGTDERTFEENSVTLSFDKPYGKIDVTLITKSVADPCFPQNDLLDTLTKSVYILPLVGKFPFEGTFRGYNTDEPNHIFEVSLAYFGDGMVERSEGKEGYYDGRIHNLPEGCTGFPFTPEYYHTGMIWFSSHMIYFEALDVSETCLDRYGYATVSEDRSAIVIDYETFGVDVPRKKKRFIGKRK
jgi:hypothetical protein